MPTEALWQAGQMTMATISRTRMALAGWTMTLAVLYIVIDLVLQLLPPHYSVVSDAESNLAVGPFGWVMQINFASRAVMSGCLVATIWLAAPASRRKSVGCLLIAFAGLCSLALVFFATDVNRPGEFGMTPRTLVGTVHVVFATAGFVGILIGMLVLLPWVTKAIRGPGPTIFLTIAMAGLLLLGASLLIYPQVAGLAERLCLVGILGWAFVVSLGLRRDLTRVPG